MPATFDQLCARLYELGVNMKAIDEMNLPLGQLQELCQRVENLVLAQAKPDGTSPPGKDADIIAHPDSF